MDEDGNWYENKKKEYGGNKNEDKVNNKDGSGKWIKMSVLLLLFSVF